MSRRILVPVFAVVFVSCALAVGLMERPMKAAVAATTTDPAYTPSGDMLPPANYREWVYLSTGIDMSYTPKTMDMAGHSTFDNVFVSPEAYRRFIETGTWPDKTVMVLEGREAKTKGSINQSGHFQGGEVTGMEVHVKDEARYPGKCAFFDFDSPSANGKVFAPTASCNSCHQAHAAVDTTFVQFYPTLLPIAQKKGTLSKAYVKESAEAGK